MGGRPSQCAAISLKNNRAFSSLLTILSVGISIALLAWLISYFVAHAATYSISAPINVAEAVSRPVSRPILPLSSPPSPETDEWAGYPLLERISACESTGDAHGIPRQFLPDGSILWGNDAITGKPIKRDIGMFQINEWVWKPLADKMGDDLATSKGNFAFGIYLYNKYGTAPWTASERCWKE